jgi:hypothetical protein
MPSAERKRHFSPTAARWLTSVRAYGARFALTRSKGSAIPTDNEFSKTSKGITPSKPRFLGCFTNSYCPATASCPGSAGPTWLLPWEPCRSRSRGCCIAVFATTAFRVWPRRDNEAQGREGTARVDFLAAAGRPAARKAGPGSRQSGRSLGVYFGRSVVVYFGRSVLVRFVYSVAGLWPAAGLLAGLLSGLLCDFGRWRRMRG